MPQIRSKQIKGDEPIIPTDLTTKNYVDEAISNAVSSGAITVEDEGVEITSGATTINFVGSDVRAELDVEGNYKVNVFIPPPLYSPFFNSSNSSGDATLTDIPTTDRRIAKPTSEGNPYKIGDWANSSVQKTLRSSKTLLEYNTPDPFSVIDNTTTFTVKVFNVGTASVVADNTIVIDGDKTNTINGIEIETTNFTTDSDKFHVNISIIINVETILPNGGRFSVEFTHDNNTDGIHTYQQNNLYRDNEAIEADISGTLNIIPVVIYEKTISGVKFYTTDTEWDVTVDGLDYLNFMSYPLTQQVRIEDNNFFISEVLNLHGNGGGSYYPFDTNTWTSHYDNSGATFNKSDWVTDDVNYTNWSHIGGGILNTNGRVTLYDWEQTVEAFSQNYNYLIDTLVDDSDRNSERFRSEDDANYPRLQSDATTPWDKTETLDNNNGLQILGDRLVYPQYNFENYLPNVINDGNDYTTLTSDREYIRQFYTFNSLFVSNGKIVFSDHNITENDIANDIVIIELSIDGGTTWLTFNGQFGLLAGSCRVYIDSFGLIGNPDSDNDSLAFTFGNPPNNYATSIKLKITFTYTGRDKYIGGIDILNNEIDGGNEWA